VAGLQRTETARSARRGSPRSAEWPAAIRNAITFERVAFFIVREKGEKQEPFCCGKSLARAASKGEENVAMSQRFGQDKKKQIPRLRDGRSLQERKKKPAAAPRDDSWWVGWLHVGAKAPTPKVEKMRG